MLALTVNVPATSPTSVQNTASVSGGGALNSATSNTDTVPVIQVATKLAFTTQPAYANTWRPFTVVVQIQEAAGNLVAGSTAPVSISSTPPGVGGTLTVNAVGGIATFSNLSFTIPANYTSTATSAGLASANSTNISLNHLRDFGGNGRSSALLYDPSFGQSYTALSNGNGTYRMWVTFSLLPSTRCGPAISTAMGRPTLLCTIRIPRWLISD